MRILVTGGAGFIGSHIVDQYIAAGHEVTIIDNLWEEGGGKEATINPKACFFRIDITDEAAMERVFNEIRPEVVNHHAAQRGHLNQRSPARCPCQRARPAQHLDQLHARRHT